MVMGKPAHFSALPTPASQSICSAMSAERVGIWGAEVDLPGSWTSLNFKAPHLHGPPLSAGGCRVQGEIHSCISISLTFPKISEEWDVNLQNSSNFMWFVIFNKSSLLHLIL